MMMKEDAPKDLKEVDFTSVLEMEAPDGQGSENRATCWEQLMAICFCRTWRQPLAQMRDEKVVRSLEGS